MKQNIRICVIALALVAGGGLLLGHITRAATTANVNATVTAVNLAVSVADGSIAYGSVNLNTATTTVNNGETQVVTNDGSDAKLNVKSTHATGGVQWTLNPTTGSNLFVHEVSTTTGSTYMKFADDVTYITASSTFPTGAVTQNLDFQLTTPTASTDFNQKSITITVQVVSQ